MRKLNKLLLLILLLISVHIICYARYYENIGLISGKAIIAEPVFKVEKVDTVKSLNVDRNTNNEEYSFIVKNYYTQNTNTRITETDLIFNIEIINLYDNFPVEYKLYDCSTGEELLQGESKTNDITINKGVKFENQYKLVICWKEKDNMSDIDNIDIVINASQKLN